MDNKIEDVNKNEKALIEFWNRFCKSTKSYLYKYYITGEQDFETEIFYNKGGKDE